MDEIFRANRISPFQQMTSNTDNSGKEIVVKNEPTFAVKRRFGKYSGHYELEKKNTKKIFGCNIQGVPKKGYPLKSSASAACSNLTPTSPRTRKLIRNVSIKIPSSNVLHIPGLI